MAAKKYLAIITGRVSQALATIVSLGVASEGDIVALDGSGKLDISLLPTGLGPTVKAILTSEPIPAGKYVNIWNATGVPNVRLADFSNDRPAHGFVKDLAPITTNAIVYFEGINDDLAGLTVGSRQYLGTAGGRTEVAPTTGLFQVLGVAVSTTEINSSLSDEIVLA